MTFTKIFIFSITLFTMASCGKGGCNDEDAINFSEIATRDDGSCVYFSKAIITSISLTNYPITNENGSSWDNTSFSDPYISFSNSNSVLLHQTQAYTDQTESLTWEINPNIVISEENFSSDIIINIYDEDGQVDDEMAAINLPLYDYTIDGSQDDKYPSVIYLNSNDCYINLTISWEE